MDEVKSFEEVETKLEEMFAGIEEDSPPILNTLEETPALLINTEPGAKPKLNEILQSPKKEDIPKGNSINVSKNKDCYQNVARKKTKFVKRKTSKLKKINTEIVCGSNNKNKSQKVKLNKVESPTLDVKYRGPCVQTKSDGSVIIINSLVLDEEGDKQAKYKRHNHLYGNVERNKIRGLHISTLSNKYDAETTDKTWICVYCKFGPHKMNLGDLFGPYVVRTNKDERLPSNHCHSASEDTEKGLHDSVLGMSKLSEITYEVWIHEDCAVWAPGVFLVSSQLLGLEESIWCSSNNICRHCSQNGAMIFCLFRGCSEIAHFPCAMKNNWNLNESTLNTHCKVHSIG